MTILGASTIEEAFSLMTAEQRRSGKRREFFDHVRTFPMWPLDLPISNRDDFLALANPMAHVNMLLHSIMKKPGKFNQ